MNKTVTIIDYGLGNLHSVANAFRSIGAQVEIAEDGDKIASAEYLILPGVGAFSDGMKGLQLRGQDMALLDYVMTCQGPLMGICLGAQLLLGESEEFGTTTGLGIIPGKVAPLPANGEKVPHVGWKNVVLTCFGQDQQIVPDGSWAYFVHSFHAIPEDPTHILATAPFGSDCVTAMIGRGLVVGCQFHPEKSGAAGLKMLQTFINL